MGQSKFIISLVMISLFTIAILSYSIGFANDNNSAVTLADDSELNTLNTNLLATEDDNYDKLVFNGSEQAFKTNVKSSGDNNLLVGGTLTDVNVRPRKSLNYILEVTRSKVFGGDVEDGNNGFGIVLNTFMGVIVLLGILYAWKTIKGGNPD